MTDLCDSRNESEGGLSARSVEILQFFRDDVLCDLMTARICGSSLKAIKISRNDVVSCDRSDIRGAGVYFLLCTGENGEPDGVYVGESLGLQGRLKNHISDYKRGKEDYYWNHALLFTAADLDKTSTLWLEDALFEMVESAGQMEVYTKNTVKQTLSEFSRLALENVLEEIRILTVTLGYRFLEKLRVDSSDQQVPGSNGVTSGKEYRYSFSGGEARAVENENGFVLLAGSDIRMNESEVASIPESARRLREQCLVDGRIKDGKTTSDIGFRSPSGAASFVFGGSISGRIAWKCLDSASECGTQSVTENLSSTDSTCSPDSCASGDTVYFHKLEHGEARAVLNHDGLVLLRGSDIRLNAVASMPEQARIRREQCLADKEIVDGKTTVDLQFRSMSAAACFVFGGSVNGKRFWTQLNGGEPCQDDAGSVNGGEE